MLHLKYCISCLILYYFFNIGNHEYDDESQAYYKNWFKGQAPLGESSNSSDPVFYYSFDIGSKLHIIVVSIF